jgi:hypothetical protein
MTAVRLRGSSLKEMFSISRLPPATTWVSPSAYSVNSWAVAEAISWWPSHRKVWLPKMTSEPSASWTAPCTRWPLTKVPLNEPRSWSTAADVGVAGSSRAWCRLTSGSASTMSLLCSRPIVSDRPVWSCCGRTTE